MVDDKLHIVGVGSTTITASQGGDSTYLAAADIQQPLTVGKAAAVVTLSDLDQFYNGTARSVAVSTTPAGLSVSVTYGGSLTPPKNVGRYPVVAAVADPNYAGSAQGTLRITRRVYTLNFTSGANGTLTGTSTQSVNEGENASAVYAVPDFAYKFVNWTGDLTSTDNPLTIKSVKASMTFTANFTADLKVIKATTGAGGRIEPSGDVTLGYGATQTFVVTPDEGYKVHACLVDGATVTIDRNYTFAHVTTDHAISVTFMRSSALLTLATAGDGAGKAACSADAPSFATGTVVAISAVPDRGSFFGGWSVSGEATVANLNAKSTTVTLTADAIVTATFTKVSQDATVLLSLSASPSAGGATSPSLASTVKTDTPIVITAKAASGYYFSGWTRRAHVLSTPPRRSRNFPSTRTPP